MSEYKISEGMVIQLIANRVAQQHPEEDSREEPSPGFDIPQIIINALQEQAQIRRN